MVKKRIYVIPSLLASSSINSFLAAVLALVGRPNSLFISTADCVALEVVVEATDSCDWGVVFDWDVEPNQFP